MCGGIQRESGVTHVRGSSGRIAEEDVTAAAIAADEDDLTAEAAEIAGGDGSTGGAEAVAADTIADTTADMALRSAGHN